MTADEPPREVKHVWVLGKDGRHAGLLIEWRQMDGEWEGRVVHQALTSRGWALTEEWLPAALLDPT